MYIHSGQITIDSTCLYEMRHGIFLHSTAADAREVFLVHTYKANPSYFVVHGTAMSLSLCICSVYFGCCGQ